MNLYQWVFLGNSSRNACRMDLEWWRWPRLLWWWIITRFWLHSFINLEYLFPVSLVDGFNIPMRILSNKGCDLSDCPTDLDETCMLFSFWGPAFISLSVILFNSFKYLLMSWSPSGPEVLKFGDIGCKSACFANLDGNQRESVNRESMNCNEY